VPDEPKDLIPSHQKQCLCPISVAILAIDEDTAEEPAPPVENPSELFKEAAESSTMPAVCST